MVLLWFYLIVPGFLQNVLGLSPKTDIRLISAMVAFSMFEAAYYSEIIRAGIQSISRGQSSAALALGMTHWQSMRLVILPQAFRAMVPLLLTQGIVLFQDTSLVYVLSLADFFRTASTIGERDGTQVEMILFAGGVYFVISLSASLLVSWLKKGLCNDYPEKRFKMVWSLSGADRLLHGSEKRRSRGGLRAVRLR